MLQEISSKDKNAVFSSIELSQLLDNIDKTTLPEALKLLKEKCLDEQVKISATALHLMTSLVEKGKLSLAQCLSTLVSLVSSHTNPHLVVTAIGNILLKDASVPNWKCPYGIMEKPHPLLTVLKHNWNTWNAVSAFVHVALLDCHPELFEARLALVEHIAKAVFLDKQAPFIAKYQLLSLFLHFNRSEDIVYFLTWQQIDYNWCCLVRETLVRSFNCEERHKIIEAFTPAAAAATQYLVTHGYDPKLFLDLVPKCLQISQVSADPVLSILADTLYDCPAIYVMPISSLCHLIMSSYRFNGFIGSKVAAALLCWAIYPSSLTSGISAILKKILLLSSTNLPSSNPAKLFGNTLFVLFSNSSSVVRMAVELSILAQQLQTKQSLITWLTKLDSIKHIPSLRRLFPLLSAIALRSHDSEVSETVFRLLLQVADANISFNILCILLYKISQELEPPLQLKYLKLLPAMAVDKENVPLILGTIESLQKGTPRIMTPLRLSLLMELWKLEPRTFPCLHRLLQESVPTGEEGWELQVTRAVVLKSICTSNGSQHGKDLVGLLSGLLNSCGDEMGAAPSAIAIDAITELCRAHVVDIKGTWAALEPKMGRNRHPIVVASICRLLGEVPNLQGDCTAAVARLWSYVTSDVSVEAALCALGNFSAEDFTLKSIPEAYRKGLKLPAEVVKTAVDAAQRPEDVLTYVPGECWVLIIERIPKKYTSFAEDMVAAILKKEVAAFPRGIYHLPAGQSEPTSFSYLPPSSIVRGLTERLQKTFSSNVKGNILPVLEILSRDHNRPLPHIDWKFLEPALKSPDLKNSTLSILVHQGPLSVSARKLLEAYIPTIKWEIKSDVLFAMNLLPGLCRSVPPTVIYPFLSHSLQSSLDEALQDDLALQDFSSLIDGIQATIALGMVPEANKLAVIKAVEEILAKPALSTDHKAMKVLANCIADFPDKVLERLTSPLLWWEVTSNLIRKAALIKAALALRQNVTSPLACLNEVIDAACTSDEDHGFMIRAVISVILNVRSHPSCCSWLNHLLGRVLNSASSDNNFQVCTFLLDLLMTSVILLSGTDYLLSDCDILANVREHRLRLFPLALNSLFQIKNPDWSNILPPFVEGIYRLMLGNKVPCEYHETLYEALITLRCEEYCRTPTKWPRLFSITRNKVQSKEISA